MLSFLHSGTSIISGTYITLIVPRNIVPQVQIALYSLDKSLRFKNAAAEEYSVIFKKSLECV